MANLRKAHDIRALLASAPDFTTDERDASFWMPQPFNEGGLWVGRFTGRSPWELHATTDELLHVLEGQLEVTILNEDGSQDEITVSAGSMCVVPRGHWHRVEAREEVTSCGVTPGPTDHSEAEDPRKA